MKNKILIFLLLPYLVELLFILIGFTLISFLDWEILNINYFISDWGQIREMIVVNTLLSIVLLYKWEF